MDTKVLEEVIDIFHKAKVSKLKVKHGEIEIALEKEATVISKNSDDETSMKKLEDISLEHIVSSPMVGCFYRANSPTEDPFVTVGDMVKTGDTLCIIEAMKVMIEVKAEVCGKIKEIKVQDGQMVDFGKPLFVMDR